MAHMLQSEAWAAFQRTQGIPTIGESGPGWSFSGLEEVGPLHTRRVYTPYGPSFDSPEALDAALGALERRARSERSVYVRVEPVGDTEQAEQGALEVLQARGYRRTHHVQPEDTWVLSLEGDADALLKGIEGSKRRRYKAAAKHGLTVRTTDDPDDVRHLLRLMAKVSERNDVTLRDDQYLRDQTRSLLESGAGRLYLVEAADAGERRPDASETTPAEAATEPQGPVVVAASLVYDHGDTRYYAHSGSDYAYRKAGPNVVLLVQMILDAQAEGKKWFDFYGIAPDGAPEDHPWAGFTAFKKSFGGQPRHYLGAWEKPVRPLRYGFYNLARRIAERRG